MVDTTRTPQKERAFLDALAETCNVSKSCEIAGIPRMTVYGWRDAVPDFAQAWEEAKRIGAEALEDEASRRAFEGTHEPLTHQGQFTYLYERDETGNLILDDFDTGAKTDEGKPVIAQRPRLLLDEKGQPRLATVRKYSDTLAIFLLKGANPEKFRERTSAEISGPGGKPIELDDKTAGDKLAAILAGIEKRTSGEPLA